MVEQRAVDRTPESFQGLLLRHRGRTGLTQRQLAARVGVSRGSVQDWEAGLNYPDAQHLQGLIAALLDAGGITLADEVTEAEALWDAALHQAPRMQTLFDAVWWAGLLARHAGAAQHEAAPGLESAPGAARASSTSERRQDWGEAPDVLGFAGRAEEIATLREWVLEEHCRVVAVLGLGGIGKTMLAARLAQDVMPAFQRVYWRSVRDALPIGEWLTGAIGFLSDQRAVPSEGEAARLTVLLELLRDRRCLLVLDNFETLIEPGQREARYRDGYAGYGNVLKAIGEGRHQSCLVVTSREAAPELAVLGGAAVRVLQLGGLGVAEGQIMLADKQLSGNPEDWANLIGRFGGNGLALKVVGESVRQVFGGDIRGFLGELGSGVFGGTRRLLAQQFERSSEVEQNVLRDLAIEREPVKIAELIADLGPRAGREAVLEAVGALRRRSLVERSQTTGAAAFTLQSVVLEYVTDRLVEDVVDEIQRAGTDRLVDQPIIQAHAKDYVRQSQERLIGAPVLQLLIAQRGERGTEQQLVMLLEQWRRNPLPHHGCGPGNVINLLRLLRGDLSALDLSRLSIRQAYLQEVDARGASLAEARLADSVLGDGFSFPTVVALSDDAAYLVAGTSAGDVHMWRVADRTLLATWREQHGYIQGVDVSPDGKVVASASRDGTVQVLETTTRRTLAAFGGHVGGAMDVALSRDGRVLASGSHDGTVRAWSLADLRPLMVVAGHVGIVNGVALNARGDLLASAGFDHVVRLWDTRSGNLLATLKGHTSGVRGVALDAAGHVVVSGSEDGTIRLWEAPGGRLLETLCGHTGGVWGVAASGDGRLVASLSEDRTVRLWDATRGQLRATLPGHLTAPWGVAISAQGNLVASSSLEGLVRIWDAVTGQPVASLRGQSGGAWSIAMRGDGRLIAGSGLDGTLRLWDTTTGRVLATVKGHSAGVRGLALSAQDDALVSGGEDGLIRIWRGRTGQLLATLRGHDGGVRCVTVSREGRVVASGGFDATVRVWDASTGHERATLRGHAGGVWGVAMDADARLLASAGEDGTVRLWDVHNARPLEVLEGHQGGVWLVAISADGRLVASGGQDGIVRLWKTDGAQLSAALGCHAGDIWGLALSGNGRVVASGSFDGVVHLWDAATGRQRSTLEGHAGGIWSLALSDDGALVACASFDGTIRLWDAEQGLLLRSLRAELRYEGTDITGLTGVTDAQRAALLSLGAVEHV